MKPACASIPSCMPPGCTLRTERQMHRTVRCHSSEWHMCVIGRGVSKPTAYRREANSRGTEHDLKDESFDVIGRIGRARACRPCDDIDSTHRQASLMIPSPCSPQGDDRSCAHRCDVHRLHHVLREETRSRRHGRSTRETLFSDRTPRSRGPERRHVSVIGRIIFHGMVRCEGCFLHRTAAQRARTCVRLRSRAALP